MDFLFYQSEVLSELVAISVTATGCQGACHYEWLNLPEGCISKDAPDIICEPTNVDVSYPFLLVADDTFFGVSPETAITVTSDLSV